MTTAARTEHLNDIRARVRDAIAQLEAATDAARDDYVLSQAFDFADVADECDRLEVFLADEAELNDQADIECAEAIGDFVWRLGRTEDDIAF